MSTNRIRFYKALDKSTGAEDLLDCLSVRL